VTDETEKTEAPPEPEHVVKARTEAEAMLEQMAKQSAAIAAEIATMEKTS